MSTPSPGVLTLCITGGVGVNAAPHTKNLVPHPDFSHGQGRPFVFTPLKRSAGTCFSTAHLPFLFFVPHTRGALWKEHSKPGGDAKSPWTARSAPQFPLSSRISPVLPPLRSSCTEKFFSPIISVSSRPPTLSPTRSPCCTNLPATLFPPQAPPKSFSWFGTHGLRPCKTATKMSDTIRRPVCTMPFHAPTSHHGTNCPAFSCHTSCIQ